MSMVMNPVDGCFAVYIMYGGILLLCGCREIPEQKTEISELGDKNYSDFTSQRAALLRLIHNSYQ